MKNEKKRKVKCEFETNERHTKFLFSPARIRKKSEKKVTVYLGLHSKGGIFRFKLDSCIHSRACGCCIQFIVAFTLPRHTNFCFMLFFSLLFRIQNDVYCRHEFVLGHSKLQSMFCVLWNAFMRHIAFELKYSNWFDWIRTYGRTHITHLTKRWHRFELESIWAPHFGMPIMEVIGFVCFFSFQSFHINRSIFESSRLLWPHKKNRTFNRSMVPNAVFNSISKWSVKLVNHSIKLFYFFFASPIPLCICKRTCTQYSMVSNTLERWKHLRLFNSKSSGKCCNFVNFCIRCALCAECCVNRKIDGSFRRIFFCCHLISHPLKLFLNDCTPRNFSKSDRCNFHYKSVSIKFSKYQGFVAKKYLS